MSFTTHLSVLDGLKENEERSWERFFKMYVPLIRLHGKDCGLPDQDLDDLVQNVMLSFFRQHDRFIYDSAKGRFRDFFRKIIRARSMDILRQKYLKMRMEEFAGTEEDAPPDLRYDEEWGNYLRKICLERLRHEISPRHYQIFLLLDLQNRRVREVSRAFQIPEQTLYSIRSRTESKLKDIIAKMDF